MIYLLTIRGTTEWRLCTSTSPVTVTDSASGTTRVFWPGLQDPQVEESASNADGMEVSLSVLLPPDAWTELSGSDPRGWTAELATWQEGQDWRQRIVRVDGIFDSPVYNTVDDATEFTIIENVWDDRSIFPPVGQQAGAATWPVNVSLALPDGVDGMWYPWVFGCPGYVYSSDGFTDMYGWPVILVEIDATTRNNFDSGASDATVLIAGHPCGFSSVKLYNRSNGQSATVGTTSTRDLLGNVVTIATVPGADLDIGEGDELWASAVSVDASGVSTTSSSALRGTGDVVRWLLERSTIRLDMTRLSQLSRLNRFKVDFYVNEPTSAWGIIQDTILANEIIPAFWRRSSGGYFLAVRPFDTITPVAQIRAEDGWGRDGGVTCSSGAAIVTDATILYGDDMAQGTSIRRIAYGPVSTPGTSQSPYLSSAYAALRYRKSAELDAPGIQDPGSARLGLDLYVRQQTSTIRTLSYVCQRTGTGVEVGQVVAVTDPGRNLSGRICWIIDTVETVSETRITVETLPDTHRTGPK